MSPLSRKYYVYLRNMLPQVLGYDFEWRFSQDFYVSHRSPDGTLVPNLLFKETPHIYIMRKSEFLDFPIVFYSGNA